MANLPPLADLLHTPDHLALVAGDGFAYQDAWHSILWRKGQDPHRMQQATLWMQVPLRRH